MATEPKVCKYLDIPLQHANGNILRRMRRPADQLRIKELIEKIRRRIPDITLRTTLIVGFPGETEAAFAEIIGLSLRLSLIMWEFSPIPGRGTEAYDMEGQVDEEVKLQRRDKLMQIGRVFHGGKIDSGWTKSIPC